MPDKILRNGIVSVILLTVVWFINDQFILKTLLISVVFVAFAVVASNVTVWAFTKINFVQERAYNELSRIFLGICILIGFCIAGSYFVQVQ